MAEIPLSFGQSFWARLAYLSADLRLESLYLVSASVFNRWASCSRSSASSILCFFFFFFFFVQCFSEGERNRGRKEKSREGFNSLMGFFSGKKFYEGKENY